MYAAPAVLGSAIYVLIDSLGSQTLGVLIGSLVATLLRLAAITFDWRLPTGPRELIAHAHDRQPASDAPASARDQCAAGVSDGD